MTPYFHDEVVRIRDNNLSILAMCAGLVCTTPSAAWLASRPYADDNQGGAGGTRQATCASSAAGNVSRRQGLEDKQRSQCK